jgi:hypothetical protein
MEPDEVGLSLGQQFAEPLLNPFFSFFLLACETLNDPLPPAGWLAGQRIYGGGSFVTRSLHRGVARSAQQASPPTSRPSRASISMMILYKKST